MRPISSKTLLQDVYVKLCVIIQNDPCVREFSDKFLFDFEPIASPTKTPAQWRDKPRLTVLPTSIAYPRESSCNNNLTLTYAIVLEGFHIRDEVRAQLEWRLMYLLRYLPFTSLLIDGAEYPVIAEPDSGTWDFDSERQTLSFAMGLTLQIKV